MLTTIQSSSLAFQNAPSFSNPLASRDVNTCSNFPESMASRAGFSGLEKGSSSRQRAYKHPVAQRREGEPERRRRAFLRKVREAGDDKKWQTRSDEILRKDFMCQQKQWQEELARSAPSDLVAPEDEENEAQSENEGGKEVDMVDQVLTQEEREIEALLSLMDDEEARKHRQDQDLSDYGSDEEDYENLFLEALTQVDGSGDPDDAQKDDSTLNVNDEMDVSMG